MHAPQRPARVHRPFRRRDEYLHPRIRLKTIQIKRIALQALYPPTPAHRRHFSRDRVQRVPHARQPQLRIRVQSSSSNPTPVLERASIDQSTRLIHDPNIHRARARHRRPPPRADPALRTRPILPTAGRDGDRSVGRSVGRSIRSIRSVDSIGRFDRSRSVDSIDLDHALDSNSSVSIDEEMCTRNEPTRGIESKRDSRATVTQRHASGQSVDRSEGEARRARSRPGRRRVRGDDDDG